jgi:hypothetical protein
LAFNGIHSVISQKTGLFSLSKVAERRSDGLLGSE